MTLDHWLAAPLAHALGRALAQFLWQGALLAAALRAACSWARGEARGGVTRRLRPVCSSCRLCSVLRWHCRWAPAHRVWYCRRWRRGWSSIQ